jgi:hypothetical protein
MKTINLRNIPIGVLLISSFYFFGALVLLVNVFTNPAEVCETIARAHGLSSLIGIEFVLLVAVFALALAYGLICLSRWGFILTITYSTYMVFINIISFTGIFTSTTSSERMILFGNFIFSVLVIVYLLFVRRSFFSIRERS